MAERFPHDISIYEPRPIKDRLVTTMRNRFTKAVGAVCIGTSLLSGSISEAPPETSLHNPVSVSQETASAIPNPNTELHTELDRLLDAPRDTLRNRYQIDELLDASQAARKELADGLGLHFFRYKFDYEVGPKRSPRDELKVFTAFAAKYGAEVVISNDPNKPEETPTAEQLDSPLAKTSLELFVDHLQEMPKEYMSDVAEVKKIVLISLPEGASFVDYALPHEIHMSINYVNNEGFGHEVAHNADGATYKYGNGIFNDPDFRKANALPRLSRFEKATPISDRTYHKEVSNLTDYYLKQGEDQLLSECHAQQTLEGEAWSVVTPTSIAENRAERKADYIWRFWASQEHTVFDAAKPALNAGARTLLYRIADKSPISANVARYVAQVQKPRKDYCHPQPWE